MPSGALVLAPAEALRFSASWGCFGAIFGAFEALLGLSWGIFGSLGGPLGAILEDIDQRGGGPLTALPLWSPRSRRSGPSWDALGAVLGASWAVLGLGDF